MSDVNTARGVRLNNPGNIRISTAAWKGKVTPGRDPDFETFDTPEDGIRAVAVILINYSLRHGLNTIRGIISRWAPPEENRTDAYIEDVASRTGFDPDAELAVRSPADLAALVHGIIDHENGGCPYSPGQIAAGCDAAISSIR